MSGGKSKVGAVTGMQRNLIKNTHLRWGRRFISNILSEEVYTCEYNSLGVLSIPFQSSVYVPIPLFLAPGTQRVFWVLLIYHAYRT